MSANTVGFLGGGRIARILLEGWERAGRMPVEVVVDDADPAALARLQTRFPSVRGAPDIWPLGQVAWVFAAVHPPALVEALRPLAGKLRADAVLVSLAPKVKIARLSEALGGFGRVARSIPNAPSLVGAGFNPVAFGPGLPEEARHALLHLLEPLGACPVVPEEHLEAYAVLTAMGPTYVWFQWQALEALARQFGLPQDQARLAIRSMLTGALQVQFESGLSSEEVNDLIPVHPLQEHEGAVRAMLEEKLLAVYQKIQP